MNESSEFLRWIAMPEVQAELIAIREGGSITKAAAIQIIMHAHQLRALESMEEKLEQIVHRLRNSHE